MHATPADGFPKRTNAKNLQSTLSDGNCQAGRNLRGKLQSGKQPSRQLLSRQQKATGRRLCGTLSCAAVPCKNGSTAEDLSQCHAKKPDCGNHSPRGFATIEINRLPMRCRVPASKFPYMNAESTLHNRNKSSCAHAQARRIGLIVHSIRISPPIVCWFAGSSFIRWQCQLFDASLKGGVHGNAIRTVMHERRRLSQIRN